MCKDLFKKEDADLTIKHADECLWAARRLLNLPANKFKALIGNADENQQTRTLFRVEADVYNEMPRK